MASKPGHGATNKERQQAWAMQQRDAGLVPVTVWVPVACVPDLKRAAELIRADPELTIGRLTDRRTGRLRGLRSQPVSVSDNLDKIVPER
jgi:hypothetical protein